MKKLVLLLAGVSLLGACVTKEEPQTTAVKSAPVVEMPEVTQPAATAQPTAPAQEPASKATAPAENTDCKISGHACWDVVQKLGETKEIRTENPDKDNIWAPDIITYENPALKAWGITVNQHIMYRDGGSTSTILNDNVSIRTNRSIGMQNTPAYGMTTIKFKETEDQFVYDSMGHFMGNDSPFPN